ncbi:alcohol dehydrogenase [Mycolicibacterium peregrinum]|jgi:D-arabinose 1-dehydrogenase-like Zn-dependent alcohol dehydrogenase|uniref:Alcohol dehydrogenase n=1 Tax=Mycolicibacterium peregrinum TaxID=43304 RepID=A0A1X2B9T2_MYCPR|nr:MULTISPECIES: alcohol dehydrogenase catalytic domain-containing protein [Mycolicibacterium]MCV7202309.1 alcohol dehydrogenase catalytic domain-containing protein [Mycolicibacterium peregrinum]NOP94637.1 alcohol dehydrogenase catalytic domain-containing protein [Mycolicibacterium fortuitum]OBI61088.1 alcohol dehydrogenase [Mycolicibacterium fortuitum]OBK10260.1 alcohol dehydrogenase [Mycolicibacterium fortuitum]ORW60368.1 alcohol dehydrogenase [Mycolicibacterium peregrinum]
MSAYRAYQVTGQRQFALVEREIVPPAPGHVRVRVHSCGVCHSDVLAVEGLRADPQQPVVPGHEIVGVIDAVGDGVHTWVPGNRVGLGFLGGQCNECEFCRRGDFVNCTDQPTPGTSVDGGYAEIVYARATGLVRVPDALDASVAAPLLCAGITTFNALRHVPAAPGALVGVQGLGGLGHLGVQYAHALGFRVVAIARGPEKAQLATDLGADIYIDSAAEDPGAALTALGGAAAVVATAASGASMSPLVAGLAPRGQLVVVGAAPDPIEVSTSELIFGGRSIVGSLTGSAAENEDNLAFSVANGIAPMIEPVPFEDAPKAYDRMMSGKARFRVVLEIAR